MGNIKKTMRYFKRNGFKNTYYAVLERLFYKDVPFNACENWESFANNAIDFDESIFFSVIVPVYETKEEHFRAMIESVLNQTYSNFELILGDASKTDERKAIAESYNDKRIVYIRINENKGISENTNVTLEAAKGEYVALLDHDDLLTKDALFENAAMIKKARKDGIEPTLLYSDEDKCLTGEKDCFDPHIKKNFNLDLFLSNNYICHLSVIKGELARNLKFRPEYDGSQDYDFILRVVLNSNPGEIVHIAKILYHWRCHENSTAFDPATKEYAYDAGRRAIEDFLKEKYKKDIPVSELSHKGFYRPEFDDIFTVRPEIGAVGSIRVKGNKVVTGIYSKDETETFKGMNAHFSGYFHRKDLMQDVFALDLRTITPAPSMKEDYDELMKLLDETKEIDDRESLWKVVSIEFGRRALKKGKIILYKPLKI